MISVQPKTETSGTIPPTFPGCLYANGVADQRVASVSERTPGQPNEENFTPKVLHRSFATSRSLSIAYVRGAQTDSYGSKNDVTPLGNAVKNFS